MDVSLSFITLPMSLFSTFIIMAFSLLSLNCKGFKNACDYVRDITIEKEPLFIFLQETWHLSNDSDILNFSEHYFYKETCGVNNSAGILSGRPHG